MDNSSKRILRRVVAVISIIVFLFLVYKVWTFYNLSPGKVFRHNYVEYKLDSLENKNAPSGIEQAYISKNYKEVVQLARSSRNIRDNFLLAHAQVALDNAAAAVQAFRKVVDMSYVAGGSTFKDAAEYNLILSYILNKDYDLALEQMTKLKGNPVHQYHDKMTEKLFRQVKMLKWR